MTSVLDERAAADRLGDIDDPARVAGDREVQELVHAAAAAGERDATAPAPPTPLRPRAG